MAEVDGSPPSLRYDRGNELEEHYDESHYDNRSRYREVRISGPRSGFSRVRRQNIWR